MKTTAAILSFFLFGLSQWSYAQKRLGIGKLLYIALKYEEANPQLSIKLNSEIFESAKEENYIVGMNNHLQTAIRHQILGESELKKAEVSFYKMLATILVLVILSIVVIWSIFKKLKTEKEIETLLKKKKEQILKSENYNQNINSEAFHEIVQFAMEDNIEFLSKLKQIYPEFIYKLSKKSATLNAADLKLCGLLKLGFSTKEIATYTDSSVRSIEAKKYRLRKKLCIPSDQDINIWMANW